MEELTEEKNFLEYTENDSPVPGKILLKKIHQENVTPSIPSMLNPENQAYKDNFSPVKKPCLDIGRNEPTLLTPNLPPLSLLGRPSLFIGQLNRKSISYETSPLMKNKKSMSYEVCPIDGISPKRGRLTTTHKKKEFFKKKVDKKNNLENRGIFFLAKTLRKLRGLVSLKLCLAGFCLYYLIIKHFEIITEIILKMIKLLNSGKVFQG